MSTNEELARYINLKLAALGQPLCHHTPTCISGAAGRCSAALHQKEQTAGHPPVSRRRPHSGVSRRLPQRRLPARRRPHSAIAFNLDRPGMGARLAPGQSRQISSPYVESYRVPQGVLHNPAADRRTTQGLFHIAEGGFPIPPIKPPVPKRAFAALWAAAFAPRRPDDPSLHRRSARPSQLLHLAPPASPRLPRHRPRAEKSMEVRFLAPVRWSPTWISWSPFRQRGDPSLPENDAALDALHWTGHTGCVVLAPHLVGIPSGNWTAAHRRGYRSAESATVMCWSIEDEPYNVACHSKSRAATGTRRDGHRHRA